ncbi:MAG: HemK/PrmC family methyltransferase [Slackia sp.]|nr:HemK/PrmC family methyltransferase [Slackia sp.]
MAKSADVWTIKAALDWTVGYLQRKGDANPRLSAEWLLAEATAMRRIDLYVNFDRPLSMDERDVLRDYVARRGAGEPLQYITGEVAFRHIAVKVRPGVLIPRPETEVLVSEALALLPTQKRRCAVDSLSVAEQEALAFAWGARREEDGSVSLPEDEGGLRPGASLPEQVDASSQHGEACEASECERAAAPLVADLCTGSGCIACSIAYEYPSARVYATDISSTAVSLARENVHALGLGERVEVVECDLALGLLPDHAGMFDLVVSNPPYIPDEVMEQLPGEVSDFEPRLALAGGADGLDVYRRLLEQVRTLLRRGGSFAFELHEDCLEEAAELARAAGYEDVRVVADLAGKPRVLTARLLDA